MKWSLNLGRIAGIRLSVHWTFMILIAWVFITYYRLEQDMNQGLMGVVFVLSLFVCVILHELGHALTAKRYNIQTKSITLLPIGGLAQLEKMPENPRQELWVAIAGPLVNVVIAAIIYLGLSLTGTLPDLSATEEVMTLQEIGFWFQLFLANTILVIFNLIPAFPMDGGRVLRALLAFRMDRAKATRIAAGVGQVLAIAFVFLGFYGNIWLVFIGVFIYLGASAEANFETTKSALTGYTVKDVLMKKFTTLHPDEPLEKAVKILLDGQEQDFVVTDEDKLLGILSKKELIKGLSDFGNSAPVSSVMQKEYLTLHPEMTLQEVFQLMMLKNCHAAPVIEHNEFIGMVDRENIYELLMVKEALTDNEKKNKETL
jgi:Zn-dependent protease/predicted transcriptional regulator